MSFEMIRCAIEDNVAIITLNRPEHYNAAPPQMFDELSEALDQLKGARAVLLTGEGPAFCAGADIRSGADTNTPIDGEGVHRALTQHYNPTLSKFAALGVPVIAAVNGPAAGIGCSLALAGDFIIAAKSAYFLQAFVNIGLVADGGASWLLPRLVGKARAAELMMLGERLGAEKAAAWGLIYKAVDDRDLQTEAHALAARLAGGPTRALGIMRRNLTASQHLDLVAAMALEAEGQRIAGNTADAREGLASFLEKRKARFVGD